MNDHEYLCASFAILKERLIGTPRREAAYRVGRHGDYPGSYPLLGDLFREFDDQGHVFGLGRAYPHPSYLG
jgi:hypothetical protein